MLKTIKTYKKSLKNKRVLLRVDFNVPLENGQLKDDFKIRKQIPTIKYLLERNARIVLVSHLGRPLLKNKKFSLKPISLQVQNILKKEVKFIDASVGFKVETALSQLKEGEILMLENIRFEKGEQKNSRILAKKLARLADIYVNEAFAVSHRNDASVSAIKKYLPSFAGLLLEEEIKNLSKLKKTKNSLVIIGGAKLKTKIALIKSFEKRSKKILIGGALANNFFAALGYEIGRSLVDDESINLAKKIMRNSKNILLPVDFIVASKKHDWKAEHRLSREVGPRDYIFDIGPETVKLYTSYIKKAQNIIWNGPLGMFENENFKHGTLTIAKIIAAQSSGRAYGVVGGGETVEALKMTKMMRYVDWVSTGGGAMLSYLGGLKMPGLETLI